MTPARSAWLVPVGSRAGGRVRLVCVPYAGGGATAFKPWPALLPDWVEVWAVRLPGRETRIGEAPAPHYGRLMEPLVEALGALPPKPFALYGHSMGALVCFELARALRREAAPLPVHLFVSGRRAPHIPDAPPHVHSLPSGEFVEALRRLNGMPAAVMDKPDVLAVLLPAIRADFAIVETHTYAEEAPLGCPVSAFGGLSDPTTTAEQLAAWCHQTSGPFRLRMLPGDHFFVHTERADLLAAIGRDLEEGHGTGE